MSDKQLDIGAELGRGWNLYKANMGLLVLAVLIGGILSGATCGILGGPMTAGVFMIVDRLLRNDPVKPQVGDVFKGFDLFVQALLCFVIIGVSAFVLSLLLCWIPVFGQMANMLISLFSGSVMLWAVMFVTYRRMTAVDALKKMFGELQSGAFVMPLVFGVIASFLSGLGVIACIVGLVFTLPLSYCWLACAYETLYGAEAAAAAEAGLPPPAAPDLRL